MKKYSTAAKIRVREMSLDPIEIARAFEYMDVVDGVSLVSLLFVVCVVHCCFYLSACQKTNWKTDRKFFKMGAVKERGAT